MRRYPRTNPVAGQQRRRHAPPLDTDHHEPAAQHEDQSPDSGGQNAGEDDHGRTGW